MYCCFTVRLSSLFLALFFFCSVFVEQKAVGPHDITPDHESVEGIILFELFPSE